MSNIELDFTERLAVKEWAAPPLVSEYTDRVCKLGFQLTDLRLLGSFSTGNEQQTSDLDTWLVTPHSLCLEDLSALSKEEFKIKQDLAVKYGYPNLARHRATILSNGQTDIYEQSFAIRVGIPHNVNAIKSLIDIGSHNSNVQIEPTDIIATLREYQGLYDRNSLRNDPLLSRKFTRRVVQDMTLFLSGEYLTSKKELDKIIIGRFYNSDEEVMRESVKFTNSIAENVSAKKIRSRELSHICLLTMEKVVWELSRSFFSKRIFDEWRQMRKRGGGFFPNEIRGLVGEFNAEFENLLPDGRLLNLLANLEEPNAGLNDLENYYQEHNKWMLEAGKIALRHSLI
jgi:hypothetical protein